MYNTKSDHFSPKIKPDIHGIGNQLKMMQNHEIETKSELIYEDGSIFYFNFYKIYRQRYTVTPITTV